MPDPLQILTLVREAKRSRPKAGAAEAKTTPLGRVGAPSHLLPGQKVIDPDTGREAEVVSYGRTAGPTQTTGA